MPTLHPTHPELPMPIESSGARQKPTVASRASLSAIEFFDHQPKNEPARAVFDPYDEWSVPIRARLLDPRLQKIITAAASGWVVERYSCQ